MDANQPPLSPLFSSFHLPPTRTNLTPDDWNEHRETIRRLYIIEGRTIEDVSRILKQEYNFRPTYVFIQLNPSTFPCTILTLVYRPRTAQLKFKFRSWKFPLKNVPKHKMLKTLTICNNRQAEGRETVVTFQGQQVKDSTLQAAAMRYRDELTQYDIGSPTPCMLQVLLAPRAVATNHLLAVPSDIDISTPRPPPSPFVPSSSLTPLSESMMQPDGGETRTTPTDSIVWPSPRSEALSFLWDIAGNRMRASPSTSDTPKMDSFFGADPTLFPHGSPRSPVQPNITTSLRSDSILFTPGAVSPQQHNPSLGINEMTQPQKTRNTPTRTTPWAQGHYPQSPSHQRTTQPGDRPSVYPIPTSSDFANNSVPTSDSATPVHDSDPKYDNTRYSLTGLGLEALWIFGCQNARPQKEIPPGAFTVDVVGKQILFSEVQEDVKVLHEALQAIALEILGVVPIEKSYLNITAKDLSPGCCVPFFKD